MTIVFVSLSFFLTSCDQKTSNELGAMFGTLIGYGLIGYAIYFVLKRLFPKNKK